MKQKKSIAIIGGGASALMLACSLDSSKFNISIYEKNAALARKFLVAGKGGFNLTHSENIDQFAQRYYPKTFIEPFLKSFSNIDFINWLNSIGIETYVGSSKRIFPVKGIKPVEVLNAIEAELKKNKASVFYGHTWQGWKEEKLLFSVKGIETILSADIVVFALGGASWKVTGSDGSWLGYFNQKGIHTNTFYPSNCAYQIKWDSKLIKQISGEALKNCEFKSESMTRKGEAVLTNFGIEGSGIYPLSPEIRKQIIRTNAAKLYIDFKPDLSLDEIKKKFQNKGNSSIKGVLEKNVHLSDVQIALVKAASDKEQYNDVDFLSQLIKNYPLTLTDFAPIDEAISTVGGVPLNEVNENLELIKLPDHYCIGEMLDWDAPTGGYLLQACFSMGNFLADKLNLL